MKVIVYYGVQYYLISYMNWGLALEPNIEPHKFKIQSGNAGCDIPICLWKAVNGAKFWRRVPIIVACSVCIWSEEAEVWSAKELNWMIQPV